MSRRFGTLSAVLLALCALVPNPAEAQTAPGDAFLADLTPEAVTFEDAQTAGDTGPCRAINTAPWPVQSDGTGSAVFQLVNAGGELAIHYSVTVQNSAGVDDVFLVIGSALDTWCDGRPRHFIYGGSLGGPVTPITNGLVRTGLLVQNNGTTEDLSEFDSEPGAGDGFDNFVEAMLDGKAFVVARRNRLDSPYVRGELRGQIEPVGR